MDNILENSRPARSRTKGARFSHIGDIGVGGAYCDGHSNKTCVIRNLRGDALLLSTATSSYRCYHSRMRAGCATHGAALPLNDNHLHCLYLGMRVRRGGGWEEDGPSLSVWQAVCKTW